MKRSAGNRSIHRDEYAQQPRFPLIVCASLVQNPVNLGGLCRTCEAFRLEALVLANLAIAQTSAFRSAAASTQQWQPLSSCPIDRLSTWLLDQQQAEYKRVALHLVPTALDLTQFVFPRRSILVLGQELTGIPAEIVSLCDYTVSIPQFGLVESLNVQTAGAIAIYEYVKQQDKKLRAVGS